MPRKVVAKTAPKKYTAQKKPSFHQVALSLYKVRQYLNSMKLGTIHNKIVGAANQNRDSVLVRAGLPGTKSGDEIRELEEMPGFTVTKVGVDEGLKEPLSFMIKINRTEERDRPTSEESEEEEEGESGCGTGTESESEGEGEGEDDGSEDATGNTELKVRAPTSPPVQKRRIRFLNAVRRK